MLSLNSHAETFDFNQNNHSDTRLKKTKGMRANNWGVCPAANVPETTANSAGYITRQPFPDAVYLEADKGILRKQGISELQGNVIIQQNQTRFNANTARFDRRSNEIDARGNVRLTTPTLKLKSDRVQYNLDKQSGSISHSGYQLNTPGAEGAHGNSQKIELDNKDHLTLYNANFTTCPAPVNSWHLSSSKIELDNKTQIGTAKHVKLNVGNIPVFYYPWFRFPLNNQRLSGFLTPNIRLQSNAGISVPYYFNLAPNYDATLTVSRFADRGFQFEGEFRYLTEIHQGKLNYEITPKDSSHDNKKRDYFNIRHHTRLNDKTQLNLKAEGVSDKDYFDDQSISLETSSISSLQRRLEIVHKNTPWEFSAALEDYQVLDTSNAPYSKLPELALRYQPDRLPNKLNIQINAESTYFDRDKSTTGSRFDVGFRADKKWGNDAWYIKPSFALNHSTYSLNRLSSDTGDSALSRTLPTLTLDSGLFFDRDIKNGKYTQTLEPRLFYTYTPFKDQSAFPVFDTARTDFATSNQLFAENRFSGKDRIADTNQLTFAVTTRIQDRQYGKELFKASIGQIINFSDRRVTLPGGIVQTRSNSELVLELAGRINDNFRVNATTLYNPETSRPSRSELRLNYHDDKRRIANLSYRELDGELRQLSGSGFVPINKQWSLVGSFDQDLKKQRNLETLAGVEYQDCCWKTRLVVKRYLTADNETYDTPVFLEFELKGLGNLGSGARRQLQEKIYGYDDF
jgi:LPS-assembly protein